MPGTFLRGGQTALNPPMQPAVLLFTGFGDASNPAYYERPGDSNYPVGAANYAGLNFRAPANGSSSPTARTRRLPRWSMSSDSPMPLLSEISLRTIETKSWLSSPPRPFLFA